ncbi:MAG: hypothetical protein HY482_02320 [Candidatus Wildermuthbacteria bacterium]|nr:hypothetical protein [Candidatus Wildermuthbacteria bacterium]
MADMKTAGLEISAVFLEQQGTVRIPYLGVFAELLAHHPDSVDVVVAPTATSKLPQVVFWGKSGKSSEQQNSEHRPLTPGNPFLFQVPVTWQNNGFPFTREEPVDNFRVVAFGRSGLMTQTEIGIATRGKKFFVVAQRQWQGWASQTPEGLAFTPTARFAYPGCAGYEKLWGGVAKHLPEVFKDQGIVVPATAPRSTGRWNPGPNPYGDQGAAILYFSPIAGVGHALTTHGVTKYLATGKVEKNEILFIHFKALERQEGNPRISLAPMTWVRATQIGTPRKPGEFRPVLKIS